MATENISAAVSDFNRKVKEFAKTLMPRQVVLFHKKLTFDGMGIIVEMTPVDTGRAQGNWQVTITTPASGEIDGVRSPESVASEAMMALAQLKPFGVTHITNNLPYIERLEDGWSKKQGGHMVETAINQLSGVF